jgi:hypothetical protein
MDNSVGNETRPRVASSRNRTLIRCWGMRLATFLLHGDRLYDSTTILTFNKQRRLCVR